MSINCNYVANMIEYQVYMITYYRTCHSMCGPGGTSIYAHESVTYAKDVQ